MSDVRSAEQEVYEVSIEVRMYVLAKDHAEAERVANARNSRDDMEIDFIGASVGNWSSYRIRRQDAYMRSKCINDE